jgi:hypothetical protein
MKAPIGCGIVDHPETCLCDVKPLQVRISVSDGVHEMWMGKKICDLRGYSRSWTRNSMVDYFQDLCRFYDEWSRLEAGGYEFPESLGELSLPEEIATSKDFGKWWAVRDFVNSAYNHYGYDMNTILRQVGITPHQWFVSCIGGRVNTPHQMTEQKLAVIENQFTEFTLPHMKQLAERVQMTTHIMETMRDIFAKRRRQLHGDTLPEDVQRSASDMIKRLSLDTTTPPSEIIATVQQETGISFSISYVTNLRKRNKKRTPI